MPITPVPSQDLWLIVCWDTCAHPGSMVFAAHIHYPRFCSAGMDSVQETLCCHKPQAAGTIPPPLKVQRTIATLFNTCIQIALPYF